jgi:hypothetical protein
MNKNNKYQSRGRNQYGRYDNRNDDDNGNDNG